MQAAQAHQLPFLSPQLYPGALQAVPDITDRFLGKDDQLGEMFQARFNPEMPV